MVDTSCKDNSAASRRYLQFQQSGNIQNGHQPDNNKNQAQLVDSSRQDNSLASYLQFPQSGSVQHGHQTDNNKNQPQLVDSSCLDDSVATSEAMQYPQFEKVQNQHQPDYHKYQLQLVGTSCLDDSVAASEANYPQSDNIQNQHCSGQPYPHLDIRTSQPQQVDIPHQESSTSREDLDSTSNRQDAKQSPQGLIESNQDQTNKPYLQLDIRTYQPQQVNSSCKESSEDPTSGKGVVSAVSKDVMQYLQLETVLYKQQPSKHYPQLDMRTYQPQRVDTSCQESSDDQTSREELVSTKQFPQWLIVPNQQQTSKPYPQLDIMIYQPQPVDTSRQESYEDPTSGKGIVSAVSKDVMQYLQLETVLYRQQPSKHFPQLDMRTYQPQRVDTSRQESSYDQTSREELVSTKQFPQWLIVPNQQQTSKPYPQLDIRIYQPQPVDTSRQESDDDPSSGKELVSTIDKVKSGAVYHALAQLEDQHVKEAADSVVLWNWTFNRLDPRPRILSTINCQMAGENLVVKGFKVNLTRVQIAEGRVTPPDPVVMVTCSLENVMPAFVGESNLGPKFVIPGAAYHNTIEDTLHVITTTGNCDTPSETALEFRTALLSVMKIQALEPTTSYSPGLDDQYAAVPEHIQDIMKYARSELTQDFHLQGSSFIEGIVGVTCTLINYCQKAVMATSSECSDPETSRIWDPGGATGFVKRRD